MRRIAERVSDRIISLPMLPVLMAVVAGIIIADHFIFPLWSVVVGIAVFLLNAVVLKRGAMATLSLLVSLLLLAVAIFELSERALPRGYNLYDIKIDRITSYAEGRTLGEGRVVGLDVDGRMESCRAEVRFSIDTAVALRAGSRLTAYCRVAPFDRESENAYRRYMARRGMAGSVWIDADDVVQLDTQPSNLVMRLRDYAERRISMLDLPHDEESVAMAVTIGRTERLVPSLREDYRRSGAAHLLAVSGLHVGFVCVIASALLLLLVLLPHGQIVRSVAVMGFIWLYAAVVGFAPSIVRAALLFSLLQFIIAFASHTRSLNTLCFAAVIMLLCNPHQLWDAGFLLSYIACAAIVEWGVPLIWWLARLLRIDGHSPRRSPLRAVADFLLMWLLSAVVVSLVATLATMPLAACLFGLSSLWAVVMGPLMVLLCAIVVGSSMLWILLPVGALQPVAEWVVGGSGAMLNGVVAWCAEHPALIIEESISVAACATIYLIYIVLTFALWARR